MKCNNCNDTGEIKYYYDAGDHFGAGTSPFSEWIYEPCPDCTKNNKIIKTKEKNVCMNKMVMLSYLRNPYGIDELELRTARLQAATELERLYKIEKGLKDLIAKREKHNNGV